MKSLNEFLNESESELKPTDVVSLYVPDMEELDSNNAPSGYWDKSEEERAKICLVTKGLIDKKDINKISFEKPYSSAKGNVVVNSKDYLEFNIVGQFKVLKKLIDNAMKEYELTLPEILDKKTRILVKK